MQEVFNPLGNTELNYRSMKRKKVMTRLLLTYYYPAAVVLKKLIVSGMFLLHRQIPDV